MIELYMYTHPFFFRFFSHIQIITEYWIEFSVLYSRSPLVSYSIYHSVHMPISNLQSIFPLHLSLLVTISLCSVCESISVLQIRSFVPFFWIPHIRNPVMFVFHWLALSRAFSMTIHK